jgi:hypothetical protein
VWVPLRRTLDLARRTRGAGRDARSLVAELRAAGDGLALRAATTPAALPDRLRAWLLDQLDAASGLYRAAGLLEAAARAAGADAATLRAEADRLLDALHGVAEAEAAAPAERRLARVLADIDAGARHLETLDARATIAAFPGLAEHRRELAAGLAADARRAWAAGSVRPPRPRRAPARRAGRRPPPRRLRRPSTSCWPSSTG